jgi:hypothetical protein
MKIIGLIVFSLSLVNTLIVVFAFRDVSIALIAMFLVTLVGLPMGIHLMNKKILKTNIDDTDDLNIEGLFSIGLQDR